VSAPDHPSNAGLCRYFLGRGRRDGPAVARPEDVVRPYDTLGTHPDLVARLWDEITTLLPVDCRFVLLGAPVLMRPDSEIVFGFAGGTHTYALRLPDAVRAEALAAGGTRIKTYPRSPSLDLDVIGPEWVFCSWLAGEERWCRSGYEFAAEGAQRIRPIC
jgi:hypothetical protein